jgi:hypothetical protein
MAGAAADAELVRRQRPDFQAAAVLGLRQLGDHEVVVAAAQRAEQLLVEAAADADTDAGIARHSLRHGKRQVPAQPGRPGADRHGAERAAAQGGDLARGVADLHMDRLGMAQQCVAVVGQLDAARQPIEQAHPQLLLKELYALGQAGLRDVELGGRHRDIATLRHPQEILELT